MYCFIGDFDMVSEKVREGDEWLEKVGLTFLGQTRVHEPCHCTQARSTRLSKENHDNRGNEYG